MPEVVDEGVTGFLVPTSPRRPPPSSGVAAPRPSEFAARSPSVAFSADRMVDDYLAVYDSLLRVP